MDTLSRRLQKATQSATVKSGRANEGVNQTWKVKLAKIEQAPPRNVVANMLNLTVCVRYREKLLRKPRVNQYLNKYHQDNLRQIHNVLRECT
jgi:hypothetical protein